MTFFNTGAGKDGYFLRFETDDKEQYLYMQEAARLCLDGKIKGNTSGVYPERHAHWMDGAGIGKSFTHHCSICGAGGYPSWNYCCICGAKMDEEVER